MLLGVKDCLRHWFLILRCSWIGSAMGAIPGIGASVIDWISYGHALRTEKGAAQTFGTGDVRGVIAAESATNSREGGALVPTVAFGVPSSAGMAILLGAFLIHGLVPGPDMLTKHLDITYSMVWSIAIANILGSGLCFLFSGQLAKLATLRYTLIMPCVLSLIYIGAFEASRNWGDLYSLLFFGMLGWAMKHFKWPRPPLVLGFILGDILERYMFISIERYGVSLDAASGRHRHVHHGGAEPAAAAAAGHPRPSAASRRCCRISAARASPATICSRPRCCACSPSCCTQSFQWSFAARIIPTIVGIGAILFCSAEPGERHVRRAHGAQWRARRQGQGGDRAKDPHGHRVQDRASARPTSS